MFGLIAVLIGIFIEKSSIFGMSPLKTTQRSARMAPELQPLSALTSETSICDNFPRNTKKAIAPGPITRFVGFMVLIVLRKQNSKIRKRHEE